MRLKKFTIFGLLILLTAVFSLNLVFAQAELVGKYAKISGPARLDYLCVARTNQAYQLLDFALARKNLEVVFTNFDIVVVKNNTPVYILDIEIFRDRAKVLVLEGLQEGAAGWAPLSWFSGRPESVKLWQNHRLD